MGEMNMNQTTQPEVSKKLTRYYEVHVDLLCGGRTFKLL